MQIRDLVEILPSENLDEMERDEEIRGRPGVWFNGLVDIVHLFQIHRREVTGELGGGRWQSRRPPARRRGSRGDGSGGVIAGAARSAERRSGKVSGRRWRRLREELGGGATRSWAAEALGGGGR